MILGQDVWSFGLVQVEEDGVALIDPCIIDGQLTVSNAAELERISLPQSVGTEEAPFHSFTMVPNVDDIATLLWYDCPLDL